MSEQERLLKQINSLSDTIRRKNRALRMGISERDKYLETTFKPVIEPLKEVIQTVKRYIPPTEGDLMLPISKFEKLTYNDDDFTESQDRSRESEDSEAAKEEEGRSDIEEQQKEILPKSSSEENEEEETINPSNISKLGKDISEFGILGRKYVLKMLHSTPTIRKYHIYGARLQGNGLMIGNTELKVDSKDNIWVGDTLYNGTRGLFELIFKTKPENYTRQDLKKFKQICRLSNTHRKAYSPNAPIHKNSSVKYNNIISQLFPPKSVPLKRRALSVAEINLAHKKHKSVTGKGMLKDMYSTNIIYYNNVNKLVARMRLLHEAMEAGHTGLQNEWVALTTELKNKGVIE